MSTTQAAPISRLSLIRPMAVTHSVDVNQRLVDVPFIIENDGDLELSITDNPNLAPPGWYMLFATDEHGLSRSPRGSRSEPRRAWTVPGVCPSWSNPIWDSPNPPSRVLRGG